MDTDRKSVIQLYQFDTPLGPMYAGTSNNGLCLLEFTDRKLLHKEMEDLSKRLDSRIVEETICIKRSNSSY